MNSKSDGIISVVIPVYNDCSALRVAIQKTLSTLELISRDFEIIIAEDASTDGSAEYARSWEEKDTRIRHLHRDGRLGRGSALNAAARAARGEILCYFDVDLATDMKHLSELVGAVQNGADIATGSRLLSDSTIRRSLNREIKSRGYNFLVRLLLHSSLKDHQCGFKAFNRARLLAILDEISDTHWFWDTEVLVRAQKKGYQIVEIPVLWHEGLGTTVKSRDIWKMGSSILRLWWEIHVS